MISIALSDAYAQNAPSTPRIILDTDMGSDCDDVGALALLNEYANQGKVEIVGIIYSSGAVPYGVGVIDAINHYYGNEQIPIGASYDSLFGDPVDKMLAEKLAKDTSAFHHRFITNTDVPEQTHLLRTLLANQVDTSIVYVTVGHTKGLYDLLTSSPDSISDLSGYELAKTKIKKWVALGALNADNSEGNYVQDWNFFRNKTVPFTHYLASNFPRPTYFVSGGGNVMTGKSLAATPPGNIVRTAYRDWLWNMEKKTLHDQRPSWDLVTVYFAVEEPTQHFTVRTDGYLQVDLEQGSRWITADTTTNHHFVSQYPKSNIELANYLNQLIAKPLED
ncbi:MAG: nucleoside hydrolase [Tunicatimonas sp.]|uniref:nucleoside hydrolase n=1 Tax=Tunicatimonas sp. TaxID=1940096 RepID=UPI003C783157